MDCGVEWEWIGIGIESGMGLRIEEWIGWDGMGMDGLGWIEEWQWM